MLSPKQTSSSRSISQISPRVSGVRRPLSDPNRRKQIRNQLSLYMHSRKCIPRNNISCYIKFCKIMKTALKHMPNCQGDLECKVLFCHSNRQIIEHWKKCVKMDCDLCLLPDPDDIYFIPKPLPSKSTPIVLNSLKSKSADWKMPRSLWRMQECSKTSNESAKRNSEIIKKSESVIKWADSEPDLETVYVTFLFSTRYRYLENQPIESEERKLTQQQILLYLHAERCRVLGDQQGSCAVPFCQAMKELLKHMQTCADVDLCHVAHCNATARLFGHWNDCANGECPDCSPIKALADQPSEVERLLRELTLA